MTQKQRKRRLWGISQNVIALLSPALPIPFSHQGPSTRGDAQRFVSTVIDLVGRLIQLFPAEGNVVLYGGCEWAGVTIFGPTDGYNVVVMTYRAFLLAFFKSVCVFSSQNVCSFSLNLCGLKFSFPPVCPFVLPDNSFTLLFHHVHIQPFWELCWVTAGDNPTFSDFAKSFKLLHDRRFLSWKMYRKWNIFNTELAELCLQRFFINTKERKYSTATHLTAIQDKGVINLRHTFKLVVVVEMQNPAAMGWRIDYNRVKPCQRMYGKALLVAPIGQSPSHPDIDNLEIKLFSGVSGF